eukprot:gene16503-22527_t
MTIKEIEIINNPDSKKMPPIKEKQDLLIPDIVDKNIPNRNGFIYVLSGSGGSDKHPFEKHDKVYHELTVELLQEIANNLLEFKLEKEKKKIEKEKKDKKNFEGEVDEISSDDEDDTPDIQYSCVVIDDMADSLKNADIQKQLSTILLPQCLKNIPGYEKIVEKMKEDNENLTLSQAMDMRKNREKDEELNELLEEDRNDEAEKIGNNLNYKLDRDLSNREQKVFIDKDNKPIVAFTGTRKFSDIITDGALAVGLGGLTSRFQNSKRIIVDNGLELMDYLKKTKNNQTDIRSANDLVSALSLTQKSNHKITIPRTSQIIDPLKSHNFRNLSRLKRKTI